MIAKGQHPWRGGGGDPARWRDGVRWRGGGADLTQDGRAHQQLFEDGKTRFFFNRNMSELALFMQ